jgi:hypothetical protein
MKSKTNKKVSRIMVMRRIRALCILVLLITLPLKLSSLFNNTIALADQVAENQAIISKVIAVEVVEQIEVEEEVKKDIVVDVQYEEDVKWLAMIGHTEIGLSYNKSTGKWSESTDEAILWVLASIHNRSKSNLYPNTIKEVIMQGNGRQYNGYRSKDFGKAPERMVELAKQVINGEFSIQEDIMWYFNPQMSTDTKFVKAMMQYEVANIGGHVFCNNDGRFAPTKNKGGN